MNMGGSEGRIRNISIDNQPTASTYHETRVTQNRQSAYAASSEREEGLETLDRIDNQPTALTYHETRVTQNTQSAYCGEH
jgi:hypothetical protein